MATAPTHDNHLAAERRAMLERFYRAFNERDIDVALEHLAPGVDWANGMTGGFVHGRDAVRQYWQDEWKEIDLRVEPMRIETEPSGKTRVLVDRFVRSLDGKILSHKHLEHVYEFDGPFITRMTIVDSARADDEGEE
jgi:limonene-1,2-epoxide hydrolase